MLDKDYILCPHVLMSSKCISFELDREKDQKYEMEKKMMENIKKSKLFYQQETSIQ